MKKIAFVFLLIQSIALAETYSYQKWIDTFKQRDINNQIEVVKLQQARLNIKASLGRIIPSLDLGTVVNTAVSGPIGLLTGLSNLFGFLMPSRWFTWNESKMYYLSQYHSYIATRGNLILMAEEIFLSLKKVYIINNLLTDTLSGIAPLAKSIEFRERIGELPKGSFARIQAQILSIKSDQVRFNNLIKFYLIEMNKLINDGTLSKITGINYQSNRPVTEVDWDYEKIQEKSHELKALDALITASKYSKKSRFWSFLNFSGDGFGLSYFANNQLSTLDMNSIKLKKEQETLSFKASFETLDNLNENLKEQTIIFDEAILTTENRIEQILADYKITGNLDADDYLEILNSYLKFNILEISNMTQTEYLQAKKERLTYVGVYSELNDNVPRRDLNKLKRYQRREDRSLN